MRFVATAFERLAREELQALLPLTNSPERGDARDGCTWGHDTGSSFREILQDALRGYPRRRRSWAVVAYEVDRPVGWCLVTDTPYDLETSADVSAPTASVGFYVAPSHRRQGVGTRLLAEARRVAADNGFERVVAQPWNERGTAFFVSCGFVLRREFSSMHGQQGVAEAGV